MLSVPASTEAAVSASRIVDRVTVSVVAVVWRKPTRPPFQVLSMKVLSPSPCTAVFCGPATTFTVVPLIVEPCVFSPVASVKPVAPKTITDSRIALPLASTPTSPVELSPLIETLRFRRVPPLTVT